MNITLQTSAPGFNWATGKIINPFFFLPLALSGNSITAQLVTNITSNVPSSFTIVDADGSADIAEGYYTPDVATDLDYIWPGSGYDVLTYAINKMFDIWDTGTYPAGRTLLLVFRAAFPATAGLHTLVDFGGYGAALKHSWKLSVVPSTTRIAIYGSDGAGTPVLSGSDITSAGIAFDTTERVFTVLLDTKNGAISLYQNDVLKTNANLAAQLAYKANYSANKPAIGITILASDSGGIVNARTPAAVSVGATRGFFAMDLTDYNKTIDLAAVAKAWTYSAPYTIPKYMSIF